MEKGLLKLIFDGETMKDNDLISKYDIIEGDLIDVKVIVNLSCNIINVLNISRSIKVYLKRL